MKQVIFLALFLAPVSYAVDYRQEIIDNVITPCADWAVTNSDSSMRSDEKAYVIQRVIAENKTVLDQEVKVLNDAPGRI